MIGLLPAFCMAMGKLSRDLGLKDVPRSWRRATWFAMAFLLGGASIIALILFSEATGSESSGVGAGTGQDGSAEVRVEEVGGAPVDVELGQNPLAGAGFCILLLIGLFSWIQFLIAVHRTRRAVQEQGLTLDYAQVME